MKYFLYGYFGFNNFGDDLLLKLLIDNIEQKDKEAFFYIKNYHNIDFLKKKSNVFFTNIEKEMISKKNKIFRGINYLLKSFKYIKKSDIVVIGPGGLFLDKGEINFSILLLYFIVKFAKFKKKKIIIIGVSFDLITNYINIFLIKSILKTSSFISVRDFISFNYVNYLIKSRNIETILAPDLVFSLKINNVKIQQNHNIRKIGLCFIDYYNVYENNSLKRELFLEKILYEVNKIKNNKLFYIVFQNKDGLKDDEIYKFLVKNDVNIEKLSINTNNYLMLSDIDYFITMRYHLAILGILFNKKPILVIDHEIKMSSLKLDFNINYINIKNFLEKDKKDIFYNFLLNPNKYNVDLNSLNIKTKEHFKWLK